MLAYRFHFFHWPWITSFQGKIRKYKNQADKDTKIRVRFGLHGLAKQERGMEEV